MTTTILLADDHRILREGLRALLDKVPEFEVVGETENGRDAVQLARETKPHVVIMDVTMPDLNGIDAARQIKRRCPKTRIVALSMHADRRFAGEMLKAGAGAYVLKDSAFDELAEAIRTVMEGHTYLSPVIADRVVEAYVADQPGPTKPARPALTPREREVLQLLAEGHSTKGAAARLHLSASTVDTHRQNIMHKLDLHSVADLTRYAIREGLTPLEE